MTRPTADVLICGAGIAGVSAAFQLAVRHGVRDVLLVDERPPLTLTSDKSTEAYRNWWPGPDDAMVRLMNRSIDLLEELAAACSNRFLLNRRGYLYCTGDPARAQQYRATGELASVQGAGTLRVHAGTARDPEYVSHRGDGWSDQPDGADLFVDARRLRQAFPYLPEHVRAALHTRRCGWFAGQQLGMEQLERARAAGVRFFDGRVEAVLVEHGRVAGVRVGGRGTTTTISTRSFVNAAGPYLKPVAAMLGVDLPVFSELHLKVSFTDQCGVVPRDAPLLIWDDQQEVAWSADERAALAALPELAWLTRPMPPGVHLRPEGSSHILILWPYHAAPVAVTFPIEIPDEYPEVCLRGMSALLPGLEVYFEHLPRPYVDGGYYTRTRENRPLACSLPVEGAFVHGALSGFGLMCSSGTAELLAGHVTGSTLPPYAPAFALERYQDPAYLSTLETWGQTGQL